jgi:8-oxo-dGTP diphosphatase
MPHGRFTLCFCRSDARVLMLRRSRPPFAGRWNGLGGKVDPCETDAAGALRELHEEAGIHRADVEKLVRLGDVSWIMREGGGIIRGSMAVYRVELADACQPWDGSRETAEGTLAWLPETALLDRDTRTVAPNVPLFYPSMLADPAPAEYRCRYEGFTLRSMERVRDGHTTVIYPTGAGSPA